MNEKEIIMQIMNEQGVTKGQLAKRLNLSNQAVWDRFNNKKNKSLNVATTLQMLRALDYKLVIVPADKIVKDGIEL